MMTKERQLFHQALRSTVMKEAFDTRAAYVLMGVEKRPTPRWQCTVGKIRLLKRLIGG
jgi:hypothetical protein